MTDKPTKLGGTVSGRFTKRHPELQEIYADDVEPEGSNTLSLQQLNAMKLLLEANYSDIELKTYPTMSFDISRGSDHSVGVIRQGTRFHFVYFDEAHYIKEPLDDKEKDWKRTRFSQDSSSSTPSKAKRAALRAKRKKRK